MSFSNRRFFLGHPVQMHSSKHESCAIDSKTHLLKGSGCPFLIILSRRFVAPYEGGFLLKKTNLKQCYEKPTGNSDYGTLLFDFFFNVRRINLIDTALNLGYQSCSENGSTVCRVYRLDIFQKSPRSRNYDDDFLINYSHYLVEISAIQTLNFPAAPNGFPFHSQHQRVPLDVVELIPSFLCSFQGIFSSPHF